MGPQILRMGERQRLEEVRVDGLRPSWPGAEEQQLPHEMGGLSSRFYAFVQRFLFCCKVSFQHNRDVLLANALDPLVFMLLARQSGFVLVYAIGIRDALAFQT